MIEVLPDVYVVPANGDKGFGFSHFVRRDAGNVLLPRLKQTLVSDAYPALEALGGVEWVLISDRHFGGPGCRRAAVHFSATLVASDIEAGAIASRCKVDLRLEFRRQVIEGSDIEAIPTPGHTPGQMAYLLNAGGARCLFAGDLAYRAGGLWQVGNQSRRAMQRGIDGLDGILFDVYVGCAGYADVDSFVRANHIGDLADDILGACTRP